MSSVKAAVEILESEDSPKETDPVQVQERWEMKQQSVQDVLSRCMWTSRGRERFRFPVWSSDGLGAFSLRTSVQVEQTAHASSQLSMPFQFCFRPKEPLSFQGPLATLSDRWGPWLQATWTPFAVVFLSSAVYLALQMNCTGKGFLVIVFYLPSLILSLSFFCLWCLSSSLSIPMFS